MPRVAEVKLAPGISEREILEAAGSAESASEHPVGRAIVRFAEQENILLAHPEHFEYRIGQGVLASTDGEQTVVGNQALFHELGIAPLEIAFGSEGTEILVARGGRHLGSILVADQLRPSAVPR